MPAPPLPKLRIALAALVPLAAAMHLMTGPHPDSFPNNFRAMAVVLFFYGPVVALIVSVLIGEKAVAFVLRRRVLVMVWLALTFSGLLSAAFMDRGADFVIGAVLSNLGMAFLTALPASDAGDLRRLVSRCLLALIAVWLLANLGFAGLVMQRAGALGGNGCLYVHDPDEAFGVLPAGPDKLPLLLQRLIADRPADSYSRAYRLELRQGDTLYHWSMRSLDFVETKPDFISNLETRPCPAGEPS